MGLIILLAHPIDTWKAAHRRAKELLGEGLDTNGYLPHVTLLYLGKESQGTNLEKIVEATQAALADARPFRMEPKGLGSFRPTENSGGDTPVIIDYKVDSSLENVQVRLLRALAPYIQASQFLDFHPHATLGYYKGDLPTEKRLNLSKDEISLQPWKADVVYLMDGDKTLGRFKLGIKKTQKERSVSPKPDMDVSELGEEELINLHWDLHMMFRRELDGDLEDWTVDQITTLHAQVVDALYDLGVKHPPPPDDGLDEDSKPEEENASNNLDYTTEPDYDMLKSMGFGSAFEPGRLHLDPEWDPVGAREEVYQRAIEFHAMANDVNATELM